MNVIQNCPDLNMLKSYIKHCFPKKVVLNLKSFLQVKDDLVIKGGIILRESRIFILSKFRKLIIDELISAHQLLSH